MKKEKGKRKDYLWIWGVVMIVILLLLLIIVLRFTGNVVFENGNSVGVFRFVEKNESEGVTNVMISIESTENVIAIKEVFNSTSPDVNCSVLNYSSDPQIDVLEFNDNEDTWVLANRSDSLDVELNYTIPLQCDISDGYFYVLGTNDTLDNSSVEAENGSEVGNNSAEDSGSSAIGNGGNNGGGGGGGSGGSAGVSSANLQTRRVVQTATQEEYKESTDTARKEVAAKISIRETPAKLWTKPIFIGLLSAAMIIAILFIFLFTRKPKDFARPTRIMNSSVAVKK